MNQPSREDADRAHAAVGFFDLAGYTTLTDVHGDITAADVAERFATLVRRSLRPGDVLVKTIGDGALITARSAVDLSALAERVCSALDVEPAFPVLRIGLHYGPVVRRHDDVYGSTVNTAARVAALAAGGQVLATEAFVDRLDDAYPTRPLGPVALRGLSSPVALHELELCPAPHERLTDPVCGMAVLPHAVVGRLQQGEDSLVFCSSDCLRRYLT